jgi:hypothetical protein
MKTRGAAALIALVSTAIILPAIAPAAAQPRRAERVERDFHGRDFARFSPREREIWERGHWVHGSHGGRFGWWFVVNGLWYFYPVPVYPYPVYVPPAIVERQAPPTPVGLPPAPYWYFCDDPKGYFPYVAACKVPWIAVPTTLPPPALPIP